MEDGKDDKTRVMPGPGKGEPSSGGDVPSPNDHDDATRVQGGAEPDDATRIGGSGLACWPGASPRAWGCPRRQPPSCRCLWVNQAKQFPNYTIENIVCT